MDDNFDFVVVIFSRLSWFWSLWSFAVVFERFCLFLVVASVFGRFGKFQRSSVVTIVFGGLPLILVVCGFSVVVRRSGNF